MRCLLFSVSLLLSVVRLCTCYAGQCPDGTVCGRLTCCQFNGVPHAYACCPFVDGVCCFDQVHCCPKGYFCDEIDAMCRHDYANSSHASPPAAAVSHNTVGDVNERHSVTAGKQLLLHAAQLPHGNEVYHQQADDAPRDDNVCPDGTNCHLGTCCQMMSGGYACCPERNAVCCSDHIHCCPEHSVCDVVDSQCKTTELHPLLRVL